MVFLINGYCHFLFCLFVVYVCICLFVHFLLHAFVFVCFFLALLCCLFVHFISCFLHFLFSLVVWLLVCCISCASCLKTQRYSSSHQNTNKWWIRISKGCLLEWLREEECDIVLVQTWITVHSTLYLHFIAWAWDNHTFLFPQNIPIFFHSVFSIPGLSTPRMVAPVSLL